AQTVYCPSPLLEEADWFNGCWMLDHRGNGAVLGSNPCCSPDREVIRFGAARCEGDLIRMSINECGNVFACLLDCLTRQPPLRCCAWGIAAVFGQIGPHRVGHFWCYRRGTAVRYIDRVCYMGC